MRRFCFSLIASLVLLLAPTPLTRSAAAALPLQLLNPYGPTRVPVSTVTQAKHEVVWNGYGIDIATTDANASAVFFNMKWSDGSSVTWQVTSVAPHTVYYCNGATWGVQYSVQTKYVYGDGAVAQAEFWHLDTPSVSQGQSISTGGYIATESFTPANTDLYYNNNCTSLATRGRHVHVAVYASWGQPSCYVTTSSCTTLTWDRWQVGTWEWVH
jgi:hypothetical protein